MSPMTPARPNQGTVPMLQMSFRNLAVATIALAAMSAIDFAASVAWAQPAPAAAPAPSQTMYRTVKVGLNKSIIIDLPRDARDILVSNPVIADAVIRTSRRIYVTGIAVGQSNVIVFDRAGQQIVSLDLEVERDSSTLANMLRRLIPGSDIKVEVVTDNIVLSGSVRNAADSRRAQDIANIFGNGGAQVIPAGGGGASSGGGAAGASGSSTNQAPMTSVVNLLTIEGEDQVHLKVTIAEIQRNISKQLGVEMSGNLTLGNLTTCASSTSCSTTGNPFGITNKNLSSNALTLGYNDGTNSLTATLRALEQTGMLRTLAEPTLTAISGEAASFLAGGEFPVPTGRDSSGNITIEFKPFGVALGFTPVVLSEGRISLRVKTEVSELSADGSFTLSGAGGSSLTIPGRKVRRAESTMELPSGGSLVMGGLLQDAVRQSIAKFPGLGNLPILGTLFRSRDFQRNETELVIIITPYLVKPTARSALATPDQGYSTASDAQGILLGNINRVYRAEGAKAPKGTYQGHYGFIIE
ncbi:type II and III secretion system protein family protein [soil metagenome]